ncbi:sigma-70 family RNA polymerase sigma factor [Thalassobacillus pellis]|uniref:sigma-70 family RNA polymerase sigma factor n=1 Tax=Thalassobacillus pellis TaxID=748008 RepID=UPI001EF8CA7D|nr:sigma-70 family RNA polymerase sigma factor [Thalassobacillus pellis]
MGPGTKKVSNGNDEQVEELVPKLYQYCRFLAKDKWEGDDIAQEAITKALIHYRDQNKWSASLLKKIAYHIWVDRIRDKQREKTAIDDMRQVGNENDSHGLCEELLEKLAKQLTPKQLVTFVLKEAFQYKISEIAELLKMSETGVKALLNRARSRVKNVSEYSNEIFWKEENYRLLYPALVEAISLQDPDILLKVALEIFKEFPISNNVFSHSPSSILSLAS